MRDINNISVNQTPAQITKLAIMVNSYGGVVEMESSPGVWITVHNPMSFENNNFRPKIGSGFRA